MKKNVSSENVNSFRIDLLFFMSKIINVKYVIRPNTQKKGRNHENELKIGKKSLKCEMNIDIDQNHAHLKNRTSIFALKGYVWKKKKMKIWNVDVPRWLWCHSLFWMISKFKNYTLENWMIIQRFWWTVLMKTVWHSKFPNRRGRTFSVRLTSWIYESRPLFFSGCSSWFINPISDSREFVAGYSVDCTLICIYLPKPFIWFVLGNTKIICK